MTFKIHVVVRDGRAGRVGGPAGIDGTGKGEILQECELERPVRMGEMWVLPSGEAVMVIGITDNMKTEDSLAKEWEQVVSVGTWP